VPKGVRFFDGLAESMSVFYVAPKVADSRVEDIAERVFAKEEVAEYARAWRVLVVYP
jgi:hypothetical protein